MTQRSILITGCSTGIGLATARLLRDKGWRVFATARKPADLQRLERDEKLEAIPLELADMTSIAACATEVLRRTDGRLTALYNNAAYGLVGAMEDISGDALARLLTVNVVGMHELTRLIIPAMRRQGYGRIVNCSSVLGFVSGPYRGAYSASKYAVEGMTDALRMELQGTGILVSLIEPGPIESEFLGTAIGSMNGAVDRAASPHAETYQHRLAAMQSGGRSRFKLGPDAVARKVAHAVESPRPKIRYRVSILTYASALGKRLLPDRIVDMVIGRM